MELTRLRKLCIDLAPVLDTVIFQTVDPEIIRIINAYVTA